MFSTKKFGAYLSSLRKKADMTQSELADQLNLTRQAISKYEVGDSFPDISILIQIVDVFDITFDELINSGDPTRGESKIITNIVQGKEEMSIDNISDIVNLAPLFRPSILTKMANGFSKQGIDISNIVKLAEFLNDEDVCTLLEKANFDTINEDLLEKFIPFLDDKSKVKIFEKVLNREIDWHLLVVMRPYMQYLQLWNLLEAAVLEGALPMKAIEIMREKDE